MQRREKRPVPVTMGSPQFLTIETSGFLVTDAWFPPGAVLPRHTHDRAIFATMLEGRFDSVIAQRRIECTPASVWVEPNSEPHANFISRVGARVVVLQPNPALGALFEPFESLLTVPAGQHHGGVAADARRIAAEIASPDALTALTVESIALGMLVSALRASAVRRTRKPPQWLLHAQELLHARFREPLTIGDIATTVGVHPAHLAHCFRHEFRTTIGVYVRRLRAEWAAEQLRKGDASIVEIALAAGYSDQSHLTRECRRYLGVTPAAYRAATESRKGRESRNAKFKKTNP
jgi:AraC family transcriptional regulator